MRASASLNSIFPPLHRRKLRQFPMTKASQSISINLLPGHRKPSVRQLRIKWSLLDGFYIGLGIRCPRLFTHTSVSNTKLCGQGSVPFFCPAYDFFIAVRLLSLSSRLRNSASIALDLTEGLRRGL